MGKLNLAILFGGCSCEHEVSLQSAYAVIKSLDPGKYEPILIGITLSGEWFRYNGDPRHIQENTWHQMAGGVRAIISPSRENHGLLEFWDDGIHVTRLDAAFPVLHGKNGEDGTIQGLLELAGIPVVGCKTLCSALCMDKSRAHKMAERAGVKVPQAFVLGNITEAEAAREQAERLGYPLFVKPVKAGSSFGITRVTGRDGFLPAVERALAFDQEVIVEEGIPGFEVGCAILGNDDLIVGELDEVELADGFFDYKEKYTLETSRIHVPARISGRKANEIKETAKIIYRALGCTGFARVDMFLTTTGEIVFNEVNTIPGFTSHSRYPSMLKAIGFSFAEIIDTAIGLAVKP